MTESTTTSAAEPTAPAPKKVDKKSTNKTVKKPAKSTTTSDEPRSTRSVGDVTLSVDQRREKVVKTMIKIGANNATSAKTADQIAAKTGFTRFDIYGLLYHTNFLAQEGYVKQVKIEGVKGLSYYLTAKGSKGFTAPKS